MSDKKSKEFVEDIEDVNSIDDSSMAEEDILALIKKIEAKHAKEAKIAKEREIKAESKADRKALKKKAALNAKKARKARKLRKLELKKKRRYKYTSPKRVIIISIVSVIALFGLTLLAFWKYFSNRLPNNAGALVRDQIVDTIKQYAEQPVNSVIDFIDEVNATNSLMEVDYISVGQGDCTLITCDGMNMLIDASLDEYGTYIQNYLYKKGIHKLDYVILTHYDYDHAGGMDVILQKFDCENVFMSPYVADTKAYRDVLLAVDSRRYRVNEPLVGTCFKLGEATVTIIGPTDYKSDVENDYSTALLVRHGSNRFLFTADAEHYEELKLANGLYDVEADVYKVGHHGSHTSSCDEFLSEVHPDYAVISCGMDNPYGHPHKSTLEKLKARGIKTFRTDEQGTIVAISNGEDIYWNNEPSTTWKSGTVAEEYKKKGKKDK